MTTEQTLAVLLSIGLLVLGGAISRILVLDGVSAGSNNPSPTINNQINN